MNEMDLGLTSYNFEPEYTDREIDEIENEENTTDDRQIPQNSSEYCECEHCIIMPSFEENICCNESDLTVGSLEDRTCITEHPDFSVIVLNPAILQVAFIQLMAYKGSHARAPDTLNNTQSRLTAYRQFVCWMMCGEKLGKGKRVVIPSCVVDKIRRQFPDQTGHYTGFKTVIDSIRDMF